MRIVFTASNSWLSRTIRFITRSKVSHVAFVYYDKAFKKEMVLEAISTGFHIRTLERMLEDCVIVESFDLPQEEEVLVVLSSWLDTPYDYGGLLGQAFVQIARIFRRRIRNPFASKKAFFCSEIAVSLLQAIKYPGSEILIPENTDPQSLLRFLNARNSSPKQ